MSSLRTVARIVIYLCVAAAVLAFLGTFVMGSYFDSWDAALGFGLLAIGLVLVLFRKKLGWILVIAGIAFLGFADTT